MADQAQVQALRDAADNIVILNEGICPSCRTNAEAEAETWLRARADDLEKK